jgi:hypothetical protein
VEAKMEHNKTRPLSMVKNIDWKIKEKANAAK